jgi:hypothetical protein
MQSNLDDHLRAAAERMRRQKEKEEREEREFYEKITTGTPWHLFVAVVIFSTLFALVSLIDVLFDGPSKQLTEKSWDVDADWQYSGHVVLNVEGYMFTPTYYYWYSQVENSATLIYSPILRTGKKLSYESVVNNDEIISHIEIRQRSFFNWFPLFQLFLLIPLVTYVFKRQSPWFNFARIVSLFFVFPGAMMVLIYTYL